MTLRMAHELGLALAMSLALVAVLLGGELPPAMWLALASPWLALGLRLRGIYVSTVVGSVIALASFAWSGLLLFEQGLDGSMVSAAIALVGIVVARLVTRRTPNHDLQALVLSLLLVFAGTVLHQQFTYGVSFLFYAVAVTWALVTRQLVAGAEIESWHHGGVASLQFSLGRRDVVTPTFFAVTAGVALTILLCTTLLFILFPRVGLGSLAWGRNGTRLPSDVSLLGTPRAILGGNNVVARVRGVTYKSFLRGLYLRGSVYDQLDATGFRRSNTLMNLRPSKLTLAPAPEQADYEVFLEPVTDQLLLTLGPVHTARPITGGFANPSVRVRIVGPGPADELTSMSPLSGPMRYEIIGGVAAPRSILGSDAPPTSDTWNDPSFGQHFLTLPARLDARVAPLAQQIVGNLPTFGRRAAALRRYLLNNFTYTLAQPNAGKSDPLAAFLFEDRRGHCEYFATAFAVLLRAAGVPSRVVGGYQGGTWDEDGPVVIFTGANAHAWVEWYEPGRGWIVDDATPEGESPTLSGLSAWMERMRRAWDDKVVEFGFEQQLELFNGMVSGLRAPNLPAESVPWRPVVKGLGGLVAAALALWAGRLLVQRRRRQVAPLTAALLAGLGRVLGRDVPQGWTLREAVRQTDRVKLSKEHRALLWEALACYELGRFGQGASMAAPRQMLRALRKVSPAP